MEEKKVNKIFDRVIGDIKKNKQLREEGKDIMLPFPFARFANYVPGIQKGRYIIVTANSKIGKSQITDYLFVYHPFYFTRNRVSNIKVRIFYFTLEMSKEDKIKQAITHKLYRDKKVILSPEKMDSLFPSYTLTNEMLREVEGYDEWFDDFEKTVTYIDNIRNPFGIYKEIRNYAHTHGKYVDNKGQEISMDLINANEENAVKSISHYVPDDPDEYVIVITDHLSLLTPEHSDELHTSISKFSSDYSLKMRDRWKYIVVNVQQQAAAQEGMDNVKLDKLQPSFNGLADNKLTGRDCDMMLGLFAPSSYKIKTYEGYDITKLKDNHRELSIIRNRRGNSVTTQLYFNGAVTHFAELPKVEEMTAELYAEIESKRN